jgi:exo-beta-1,3-glucanase (GH17 family)
MKNKNYYLLSLLVLMFACNTNPIPQPSITASQILGNPEYQAISYSGYRDTSRNIQPNIEQLKEDMLILSAMGIKMLRTYDVIYDHTPNLLKAIHELKQENPEFEMYLMLGAWIDCKNAWTDLEPNHMEESEENAKEIERAIRLANEYPDIVKVIAVGNEAMIRWATSYYVQPDVILKWVSYLQDKKAKNELDSNVWITCSDNFASWGGGDPSYHTKDLEELIHKVDFISVHTYPMHDTHYNPAFWGVSEDEKELADLDKIDRTMTRAVEYAQAQYASVQKYMHSLGVEKPIHIGETGWATVSTDNYGKNGSRATDEYKSALYYEKLRQWCDRENISCFYFEAFDEPWKDAFNPLGSENHFGLFTVDGKAKFTLWKLVDSGLFKDLKRGDHAISKTYQGSLDSVLKHVSLPPANDSAHIPAKFY